MIFRGHATRILALSAALPACAAACAPAEPDEAASSLDLPRRLHALEVHLVGKALEQTGGNQTRAAKLLNVSRFGLQKMMKRLGVET